MNIQIHLIRETFRTEMHRKFVILKVGDGPKGDVARCAVSHNIVSRLVMIVQSSLFASRIITQRASTSVYMLAQIYLTLIASWAHMNLVLVVQQGTSVFEYHIAWDTDVRDIVRGFIMGV